jgi:hypothetical protein
MNLNSVVLYEMVSESSWTVVIVTALVKEDERGDQGRTSKSLLHQSATWHCTVNTHCFYSNAFTTSCFVLSAMDGKIKQYDCIKLYVKLSKYTTENIEKLWEAIG